MKRAGNEWTGVAHNHFTLGATPRPATRIGGEWMRRVIGWGLVASFVLLIASSVSADRSLRTVTSQRIPFRAYVGATPQQYDTLVANPGERIELVNFTLFMDDSAMTPTLNVAFQSGVTKLTYLKITPQTFTANQQLIYSMPTYSPIVFPNDSTILIYYNITSTAPGTLDTLKAVTTYRVERY